ncbi:FAD-dependent oxidoreductase [Clostridium sp. CS001]|uniref:FAD-dependent oxidoreductase n=1 Tax=Clostridium sp. CS001 TaxID=2880648 RepID=UPI001CF5A2F0|nr:FAD-dependent oxidoreductase [Clostridium sp. CS001]MCB2289864.1 FAD-dependent oxidoreductase [Clostridium sp. CS001]
MSKLFTEFSIGSMKLKNRTFMAPMSLGYESQDGSINEVMQEYWLERAKGGVGCIILDAVSVDPSVPYLGDTLSFRGPESIEKYKVFTDKVHEYGAKVIPQITHPGPESISSFFGVTPVASSTYINSMGQKTRALKLEEIPAIIEQYANAAFNAKLAGFDGIELHCAHAYMLLGSFLSPMRNKRIDEYGGSLDNRARLLFEVIDAIKEKCSKDFPVILRISGSEKDEQGNNVDDIKYLVNKLVEHGIDAFEISGGTQYEHCNKIIPCHGEKEGLNLPEAKAIKEVSKVPVIVVGKFVDPRLAMYVVDNDLVDGVVFGRALLADPELVNKAQNEKFDEIAPCATCAIGCIGEQIKRKPASCVINPALGRERELQIIPTEKEKNVVIVGGGIGGMAAARVLALRGHHVTLLEKTDSLGGQLKLACVPPHKQEISKWTIYLSNELSRLNVSIVYNCEATMEVINKYSPDSVIIATGAKEILPPVHGINVETALTAQKVLSNDVAILGGNVLVVGGGMVGIEVCEYLMHNKRGPLHVTMIEMAEVIGAGMVPNNLLPTMDRLNKLGINMMTSTKIISADHNTANVECRGEKVLLSNLTNIIYACGSKSENTLYENIKDKYEEIYCIGDAKQARQALQAVCEGVEIGIRI